MRKEYRIELTFIELYFLDNDDDPTDLETTHSEILLQTQNDFEADKAFSKIYANYLKTQGRAPNNN